MKIYMSNIEQIKNVHDLESKLSKLEILQYNKFSNEKRKLQYLMAHAVVRDVCGENITADLHGRPTIKSGFISVAHKDNWVIVAISNAEVGIDIENTNINRDFVGTAELLNLPKTTDKKDFYKNFVRYEAGYKFGNDANQSHMYFYEFGNYLIGVCTKESAQDIKFISTDAVGIRFVCAE